MHNRSPEFQAELESPGPNGVRFDGSGAMEPQLVAGSVGGGIMEDDTDTGQFTPGCAAYAGYINGYFANMSGVRAYAAGQHAHAFAYTPDGDPAANALDIEPGDATEADGPPFWRAKGGKDPLTGVPCLYGSASWVGGIIAAMSSAGIKRNQYKVISAHYIGAHVCGPSVCGYPQADATQFTDTYQGRSLDATVCSSGFFAVPPSPTPAMEDDDMPYGQLAEGKDAITPIALPKGKYKTLGFTCDNGLQGMPAAEVRVAVHSAGGGWSQIIASEKVVSTAQSVVTFKASDVDGVSVQRVDAGDVHVAYEVS